MKKNFGTLDDKRILITGGTGSFGNYILKTLLGIDKIKEIVIFSRDEDKQHQLKTQYSSLHKNLRFEIGDVRSLDRVREAMRGIDIVFNAAALKQVPNNEVNPYEAVLTNIIGAKNIATGAIENNVAKVIGISTDKAVKPVNAMGMTKALQEKIFTAESNNQDRATRFACVRYGNVLGSRGSVIPFFKERIERGEKLPVTHSEMTRFLLSLKEAIALVLYAVEYMKGGEIFVKKSPSCKITMLADVMYRMLGGRENKESKYYFSGVRPGEKIHEILISEDESRGRVKDNGEYYTIYPYWRRANFPEIKEFSSNPATITDSNKLEALLLSADNITWEVCTPSNSSLKNPLGVGKNL